MRDKILTWIKGHKLLVVFLAAAIIKQLLVIGLPICPAVGTPCDDELMRDCSVYREISVSQMGDGAKGKTEEVLA